jgi:hypothetical protein
MRGLQSTLRRAFTRAWALLMVFVLAALAGLVPGKAQAAAPENDNFSGSQIISGEQAPVYISSSTGRGVAGSNIEATTETGEPAHGGFMAQTGASVWYQWTPPSMGRYKFSIYNANFFDPNNFALAVYTGSSVNALTPVITGGTQVTITTTPLATYYIAVAGISSFMSPAPHQSNFILDWAKQLPPANDNFAAAQVISTTALGTVSGTNANASKEAGEPNHAGNNGGASVWYKWTAPAAGRYQFTISNAYNIIHAVYTGSSVNGLTSVSDTVGRFNAVSGATYYIAVDGYYDTWNNRVYESNFTLGWQSVVAPTNDNFANAEVISGEQAPSAVSTTTGRGVAGTNENATAETGEPQHNNAAPAASVWYKWTAPATANYKFSTLPTYNYGWMSYTSHAVSIYTGSSVGALTSVASGQNAPVRLSATANTIYYVAVSSNESSFYLDWQRAVPPANDDFANAQAISNTTSGSVSGTNVDATREANEPQHNGNAQGASVWYKWTAPAAGRYRFTNNSLQTKVYSGNNVGALTLVSDNNGRFQATSGATYYIAVEGSYQPWNGSVYESNFTLSWEALLSPANDNFANAEVISGEQAPSAVSTTTGRGVAGSNENATAETGEPQHNGNAASGASVWYKWTAPATANYKFFTLSPFSYMGMSYTSHAVSIYSGSSVGALTSVASGQNAPVRLSATANTVYYIAVSGSSGYESSFYLDWQRAVPPANDDFANAQAISNTTSGSVSGTNVDATREANEPQHNGNAQGASVWYKWTAPAAGRYRFTNNSLQTKVYSGNNVGALTLVSDNNGRFQATSGATYYIAVDGYYDTWNNRVYESSFTLGWQSVVAPTNDNFAAAQVINGEQAPAAVSTTTGRGVAGTNENATAETGEPQHNNAAPAASVWYKWTAPATANYKFSTLPTYNYGWMSYTSHAVSIYTGSSVGALTSVASGQNAPVRLSATANTIYYVAVSSNESSFYLDWQRAVPPANDDFANAQAISNTTSGSVSGTNVDATREANEPQHNGNAQGASVWYKWTAPAAGRYQFTNSSYLTIKAYSGSNLGALTSVSDNRGRFVATSGTIYYIAVDGYYDTYDNNVMQGSFTLSWQGIVAPANDNFVNAQSINGEQAPSSVSSTSGRGVAGTNLHATTETGEPQHNNAAPAASVWYKWTAPTTAGYVFSTMDEFYGGGNTYHTLSIYTGSNLSALTAVSSKEADPVRFAATAGTNYYIAISGSGSEPEEYGFYLDWRRALPPANDNFANAQAISNTTSGSVSGTNLDATKETGEPDHANGSGVASVWYKWTPAVSGSIDFTANSRLLGVYTGNAVNALSLVARSYSSRVRVQVVAGTPYYIAVDGSSTQSSEFTLNWIVSPTAPANDDFANAQVISSTASGSVTGSSVGASKQSGEPNHKYEGGSSIWYKWVASADGTATFTAIGTNFDPLMASYSGTELSALTQLAAAWSHAINTTSISFPVSAGSTYYIAIDGYYGESGNVKLTWDLESSVVKTLTVTANPGTFTEGGGANASTGTVSRSGSTSAALTVNLSSSNTGAATVPATVVIPANSASANFSITAVDDNVVDGSQTATITTTAAGLTSGTISVTVTDNDTPGISVTPSSGLTTNEGGAQSTFTVVLTSQPTDNVAIGLSSSNPAEGTVGPATLVFTAANWNQPQAATVTGVNDDVADGAKAYTIVTAPAQSNDANYNGRNAADVSVTNNDNDSAQFSLSIDPATITEGGTATARLTRNTLGDLTVALASGNTANVSVPVSVAFAADAFTTSFAVTGIDDAVADGTQTATITASANGMTATADVTVLDNDTPAVSVTPANGLTTNEAGAQSTFTVVLSSQPTADVTIGLSSSNPAEGIVTPALVFTTGNWNQPQTATITGVNDNVVDGNQTYTVVTTVSSADANYNGREAADVSVTNVDDDTLGLSLTLGASSIAEGGSTQGQVSINSLSGGTIALSSSSGGVTVPATVSIPAGSNSATFTITSSNNNEAEGDRDVTITASQGALTTTATFRVTDDERASLTLTLNKTSFTENVGAAAATGTLTRNIQLSKMLTVALSSSDLSEARVLGTVTIPAGSTTTTFAVDAVDDTVADGSKPVVIKASAASLSASANLNVLDDERPTLSLTLTSSRINEGAVGAAGTSTVVTVRRNSEITSATAALTVPLNVSPTGQVVMPTSVVIPARTGQATFTVRSIDDTTADGPRTVTLTASATGFVAGTASITVVDNEAASSGTIAGKVLLPASMNSTPVPGVTLTLRQGTAVLDTVVTAANGTYGFKGLPVGTYSVAPAKSDYGFAPASRSVTLTTADLTATDVDFSGTPRTKITGTLTRRDATGKVIPVVGASVVARNLQDIYTVNTSSTGTYSFSNVPLGSYQVVSVLKGTFFDPKSRTVNLTVSVPVIEGANFLAVGTDSKAPTVSVSKPSANVTETTRNTLTATGSAADPTGGSGLAAVTVALGRFSSATVTTPSNFLDWNTQKFISTDTASLVETLAAGTSAWSLSGDALTALRSLPVGFYGVRAIAVDYAGNTTKSVWKRFAVTSAPAREVFSSPVRLSTASVSASSTSVRLMFTAALNADDAVTPNLYNVTVNGVEVAVESASYEASTRSVVLGLTENALQSGDLVHVKWQLRDDQGRTLIGNSGLLNTR